MTEAKQNSTTDEPSTCGEGLAQHATVPEKIAAYLRALADNLHAHLPTIDTKNMHGQAERDAYDELAANYGIIADRLADVAARMRDYRDLPAAGHHEEMLTDPKLLRVFEAFVTVETELVDVLRNATDQDQELLRRFQRAEPA